MTQQLVNGVYPLDYLSLAGLDTVTGTDQFWWSSKQRYASYDPNNPAQYLSSADGGTPSSEYLIIDLGRIRPVNYLSFDIIRMPARVTVQFDALSDGSGVNNWIDVTPKTDARFEPLISYQADRKNIWQHPKFYFQNSDGNIVFTRYLRLKFERQDVAWPTSTTTPFRWAISLRNLRMAHQIVSEDDLIGVLFDSGTDNLDLYELEPINTLKTIQVRQRFVIPSSAQRGDITPRLSGFRFLSSVEDAYEVDPTSPDATNQGLNNPTWKWEIHDVTDPENTTLLSNGEIVGADQVGKNWMYSIFERESLKITLDDVYELRLWSENAILSRNVYVQSTNTLPGQQLPGSWTFTTNSTSVSVSGATNAEITAAIAAGGFLRAQTDTGAAYEVDSISGTTVTLTTAYRGSTGAQTAFQVYPLYVFDNDSSTYVADPSKNLTLQVLADVVDSGKDILGNAYRYGTRYQDAENVYDGDVAGWMSAPQPSPLAVESLYFDLREGTDGSFVEGIVDAIRIAPQTPGIRMHVYYSREGLNGRRPNTVDEWEKLYWQPVQATWDLRANKLYNMPRQIRCAFLKLEFSNLRPMPFEVPHHPEMPPVEYKRYPTWVENQFSNVQFRQTVSDWFVNNQRQSLNLLNAITQPEKQFEIEERSFITAVANGQVKNNPFVDSSGAFIDPVTSSKIFFTANQFNGNVLGYLDSSSVLAQMVINNADTRQNVTSLESVGAYTTESIPTVSTATDRVSESFSYLANTPMWFNVPCRHDYKIEVAKFEGQAYFAGISEIDFYRADYTVERDDVLIEDVLANIDMLDAMTFVPDSTTGIENGQTVWVTYTVDFQQYEEEVTLWDNSEIALSAIGSPATNFLVFSQQGQKGTQYFLLDDYDTTYQTAPDGRTQNFISRSALTNKWIVDRTLFPVIYSDGGTITGHVTLFADEDWGTPVYGDALPSQLVIAYGTLSGEEHHLVDSGGAEIWSDGNTITATATVGDASPGSYDSLLFDYATYDDVSGAFDTYDDLESGV